MTGSSLSHQFPCKNDTILLTIDDNDSSSKEVSNSSIQRKKINAGGIRSICSDDDLHAKFIQAASEITYEGEEMKPSIKHEKELLLKGFIAVLTANSSLRVTNIDNQQIKLADNATTNYQGTMLQSPSPLGNKNGMSQDK
eukprot:1622627-Ditylum_brightwellii.AAC.1